MQIRTAVVCRYNLYSEGLSSLLLNDCDIKVVGAFNSTADPAEFLTLQPHVIITDFDIFSCIPEDGDVRRGTKVLLITDNSKFSVNGNLMSKLISKGLTGILDYDTNSELMKKSVKAAHSGEFWLDRKTVTNILSKARQLSHSTALFTKREKEVAALICRGLSNKEIATEMNISEQTVKSHCNRIYKKAGVTDRLHLAVNSFSINIQNNLCHTL